MVRNSEPYSHRKTKPLKRRSRRRSSHRWFGRRHATSPSPSIPATPTEDTTEYPSDEEDAGPFSSAEADANSPDRYRYGTDNDESVNSMYTLTSYVPVAPLPVFCGNVNECPFMHISRFDRVCHANNAASPSVAARIFPASLDSYAGIWYDLYIDPSLPWDDVRSAFLSAFRPPGFSSYARAELFSLCQFDDEAVNRYHLRMLWILRRWPEHGMRDNVLKEIFINGLRKELKELVTPQRVATLDEAVSLAAMWEQADGIREARRNAFKAFKCEFCGMEGHEEQTCEVKKRLKGIPTSIANGSSLKVREVESGEKALVAMDRLDSVRSSTRSVQCRCLRHQCSKKTERNLSMRSSKSPKDSDNGI